MAQIANPRKKFNFTIAAPGLNPFLCQEVQVPESSIDVVEHGDTNFDVKTGGRAKLGSVTLKKICSAIASDNWFWLWVNEVQNTYAGGGLLPSLYKRTLEITQFSNDGITPINFWILEGCWPSKRDAIDFSRVDSENTVEQIELQVDRILQG